MNSLEESLDALRAVEQRHPFWTSSLLQASGAGALTREDFRFVFSQYYFYSKNFTRYLAALMANCDNDLYRFRLTQNLWEEAGGDRAEKRHAELFRDFLKEGLGIEPEAIQYEDYTVHFVQSFLDLCFRSPPIVSAAALSLGTEGLVPRLYAIFLEALRNAGVREDTSSSSASTSAATTGTRRRSRACSCRMPASTPGSRRRGRAWETRYRSVGASLKTSSRRCGCDGCSPSSIGSRLRRRSPPNTR